MSESIETVVADLCEKHGRARESLMDIARGVQQECSALSREALTIVARELNIPRVEVEAFMSFYSFLSEKPKGKIIIRLCDDIIDRFHGYQRVADVFKKELGVGLDETSQDGQFTLEATPCIGMCDQAPAALINDVPVTDLSTDSAHEIVRELKVHMDPKNLVQTLGDGNNSHPLVRSMVNNNLREPGSIIFSPINRAEAIQKAVRMSPREVIRAVKVARLRGRGGAGFPAGMKWEFTRESPGTRRFVICNADEGEPGTFKDRVILTELADRVFAGMTIAGYAVGASEGIMYLRGEYEYLRAYLEHLLEQRRADGLLGKSVVGKEGFDFDIRIQMGAGAYVCGEETALISSCEGYRGDPRNRPPFPAQAGYLGCPTVVNNVETLCCVTKILEEGPATFSEHGTPDSTGTKLLSVSGDCHRPGVYELPFGISVRDLLERVGAPNAAAVQIGGPSGQMIGPKSYERTIGFDDLPTGGSIMVFNKDRDLLEVVSVFMDFFLHESCGYCTPCRVGNVLLKRIVERVRAGKANTDDLDQIRRLSSTMKATSRCGLGQTSFNPVKSTLENFPELFERGVRESSNGYHGSFDLLQAVTVSEDIVGRKSVHRNGQE